MSKSKSHIHLGLEDLAAAYVETGFDTAVFASQKGLNGIANTVPKTRLWD